MKRLYDRKVERRIFEPGGQVLVSRLLLSSPFEVKFEGPYVVKRKLSDENYEVATPYRRKSTQLLKMAFVLGKARVRRAELSTLLQSFLELFGDTPSRTDWAEHDIDVEWASPCLLVRKPDGSVRFCTDCRKVNTVTRPDSFPLPRVEDCVDQVGSAKYVTKLDLLRGYWQVPLTRRAQEISSFVTPSGLYSYKVMSFGLRNAPATFQRLMNRVVSGLDGCAVYLDDLVVFSDS
ncbi:gag-pol fusion protein [Pimephales promelas]|nr:gag-pol fusion protein [Pimephales promelas]